MYVFGKNEGVYTVNFQKAGETCPPSSVSAVVSGPH